MTHVLSEENTKIALDVADVLRNDLSIARIGYERDECAGQGFGHLALYDAANTVKWLSDSLISVRDAYLIADEIERNIAVPQYWLPSLRAKKR